MGNEVCQEKCTKFVCILCAIFLAEKVAIGRGKCYTIKSERDRDTTSNRPEVTRAEREKTMTVKTFLEKFLHASSTIKEVVVYFNFGFKIVLNPAALDYNLDGGEYNITIKQFSINGNRIVIYCL